MDRKQLFLATALLADEQQRLLVVRKHHSPWFIQPGGKIKAGETPIQALQRELQEELRIYAAAGACRYIAAFDDVAVNEKNTDIHAEVFLLAEKDCIGTLTPSAEIAEMRRIDPFAAALPPLASLTANRILPWWRAYISADSQGNGK